MLSCAKWYLVSVVPEFQGVTIKLKKMLLQKKYQRGLEVGIFQRLWKREKRWFNETDRESDRDQSEVKEVINMDKMINLGKIWRKKQQFCNVFGILQLLSKLLVAWPLDKCLNSEHWVVYAFKTREYLPFGASVIITYIYFLTDKLLAVGNMRPQKTMVGESAKTINSCPTLLGWLITEKGSGSPFL